MYSSIFRDHGFLVVSGKILSEYIYCNRKSSLLGFGHRLLCRHPMGCRHLVLDERNFHVEGKKNIHREGKGPPTHPWTSYITRSYWSGVWVGVQKVWDPHPPLTFYITKLCWLGGGRGSEKVLDCHPPHEHLTIPSHIGQGVDGGSEVLDPQPTPEHLTSAAGTIVAHCQLPVYALSSRQVIQM